MHSGTGNMYVHFGSQPHSRNKPSFRPFAEDQLRWLRRILVAPVGMAKARAELSGSGTLILDGEPGSGRTSTARVLLREHHQDVGVYRELLPEEPEEGDDLALTHPQLVGTGDRLLLDVSAVAPAQWDAIRAGLPALRSAVHEKHARLVVVMPRGGSLDPALQRCRIEIQRPCRAQVLRRHLRMHGVPAEQYLRPDPTVGDFLVEERPLREVAEFADLVRRACEVAAPGEKFGHWCEAARKARTDRRDEVAALVAKSRESSQRALLIAVAMLQGAHADVIHRSAQLLLEIAGSPPDEVPLLQRKDLAQRLAEVSAGSGRDSRVRFAELDYDSAVRTHVWDHMPDLREHLGVWTARSVHLNDPHMTRELRDSLVARLAGEYLRTGRPEQLAELAAKWCSATVSGADAEAAVQALTCGLDHPVHARRLRQWIYLRCRGQRLEEGLAHVLVRVCADVIADGHPDQAMLRLYYLARAEHRTSGALQSLCSLVETSHRLRRRLLDRLARSDRTASDLGVFLPVSVPAPLTDPYDNGRSLVEEKSVQHSLTACWSAVLLGLPRPAWQPYAENWMHTAAVTGRRGELLLALLVSAAHRCEARRGAAFAALYASARDAEQTAPGGPAGAALVTDLLLGQISSAQNRARPATPLRAV
ncbi:hypothetical protein [Streptomyces zhihengii]